MNKKLPLAHRWCNPRPLALKVTSIGQSDRLKMRILLILNICSALTTSPYLGTVGLTSWDRSETPVLEYRKRFGNDFTSWDRSIFGKRFAKRGPGLALFGGSDNILKRKNKNYICVRGTLFLKRKSIECVKDHQLSLLWLPAISTVIAIQNANCQPFSFVFKLFHGHIRRSPRPVPLRPNQNGNLK